MQKILKHLLLPFTALLWYLISYCVVWAVIASLVYIFDFHWAWLIFCEAIFIGLISTLFTLPSLGNYYLLDKLFGYSWVSIIFHSIAGVIGVFNVLNVFYERGVVLGIFWDISHFKTILLFFPVLGVITGMIYSLGISPFLIKIDKIRE